MKLPGVKMLPVARRLTDDERRKWSAEVAAAVGGRIGTVESRASFAEALLDSVGLVVSSATWLREIHDGATESLKEVERKRKALEVFLAAWPDQAEHANIAAAASSIVQDDRRARMMLAGPGPKRGPQNDQSLAVARIIACLYYQHLGRLPSAGRRDEKNSKRETPYHRVCDVIENLLRSCGVTQRVKNTEHPFELRDPTRISGISHVRDSDVSVNIRMGDIFEVIPPATL